jgi:hypothetical protein
MMNCGAIPQRINGSESVLAGSLRIHMHYLPVEALKRIRSLGELNRQVLDGRVFDT